MAVPARISGKQFICHRNLIRVLSSPFLESCVGTRHKINFRRHRRIGTPAREQDAFWYRNFDYRWSGTHAFAGSKRPHFFLHSFYFPIGRNAAFAFEDAAIVYITT